MYIRLKKFGFTLAEVLIVIGVLGIVAAMVMPTLVDNLQYRVRAARVSNIMQKFSEASDVMLSTSGMNGYPSTEAYVQELTKYLRVLRVCDNNHLSSCWPTEKVVIDDNGTEWNIADTKTGRTLKMQDIEGKQKWDDTMGLITADGTSMILSYNLLCNIPQGQTPEWRTADKSESTRCIAAVFDWNGSSHPNKYGGTDSSRNIVTNADVLPFNSLGLGRVCAMELSDGKCIGEVRPITGFVSKADCRALADAGYGNNRNYCNSYEKNYWAWAMKECGSIDNMVSRADLAEIASKLYGKPVSTNGNITWGKGKYDLAAATSIGFPETTGFSIWTGDEKDQYSAYGRNFYDTYTYWTYAYYNTGGYYFICKYDQ